MIVVIGRVQTDDEKREDLIRVCQKVASESRKESGNVGYRFYADTEQPGHYVFVEEWESMDALKEHFGTPHIAEFMGSVRDFVTAPPDVGFHIVEKTLGLGDFGAA
jgi:quinol monooxygenase YgiN